MADMCPNCGYCPACKRALPTVPGFVQTNGGYFCATCGVWVLGSRPHVCFGGGTFGTAASGAGNVYQQLN